MSIEPFTWRGIPSRVVFGAGTLANLAGEADRLGMRRALVIATPRQLNALADVVIQLGSSVGEVLDKVAMHTPVEITERAMNVVKERAIDGTIAIGGGSTIGLGKAIAFRTGLPQIAVPTTYAGSEMTPILGETADGDE